MSMTRNIYGLALVALAGTAVSAAPTAKDANSTGAFNLEQGPRLQHNLPSGPVGAVSPYDLVFDNMTDADSSTGYNVAYVDPGSYDGSSASSSAYLSGMSSTPGGFWESPPHPDSGNPTDVWFDEYGADLTLWGPAGTFHTLTGYDDMPAMCPGGVGTPSADFVQVFAIINFDGDTWYGGINLTYDMSGPNTTYCAWFGNDHTSQPGVLPGVDLLPNGLEFDIEDIGWRVFDYDQSAMSPNDEGTGFMIAGGDFINPDFPLPDDQVVLGSKDTSTWIASDPGFGVDPGWDGDDTDTSYLDVLNGTENINWQYTAGPPDDPFGDKEMTHDTPFRLYVDLGGGCAGDIDGDGDTDQSDLGVLLAAWGSVPGDGNWNAAADLDLSGEIDQPDLGILLADWECGVQP